MKNLRKKRLVWSPGSEGAYLCTQIERARAGNRPMLRAFAEWLAESRGLGVGSITVRLHSACSFVDAMTARAGTSCARSFQSLKSDGIECLNEVDRMLERAKEVTRQGEWTYIEYARYADDLVITVSSEPRWDWLLKKAEQRLREELTKLEVELNEEKSRIVDLEKGESFGFPGFEFRLARSRSGKWYPYRTPRMKKRTAMLRELKRAFRRYKSQPVQKVIAEINPKLKGWVNYFAIGHSSRCFSYLRLWVEKRVRRHIRYAQKRGGYGWKKWSTARLYAWLGLFNNYRVTWNKPRQKAFPIWQAT